MSVDRADRTGHVLGQRFRIDALIGKGAMADVYRAVDLQTSAYVAVKILRTSLAGDPTAKARFAREGEVQARLRHRNIAALLSSGITDREEPYLVVELLRGKNLRTVLKKEGRVSPVRAVSYAWQALQGLAEVHAAGILHRDLKPANIMLEPSPGPVDRVVLIDFGFASTEGSAKLTQQGAVVGSLRYIAPERLRAEPVDQRSDLYAIGVILYELLMGAPPFDHADDFELVEAQVSKPPPPLDPSLPRSVEAVLQKSLEKAQAARYGTAQAMADALELAARDLSS
ncbi:MAG TPA: serine/threonine-protein kinase [Kofleriaceae bacterium]|nr:serine/threonine-protein kinase [Kofleriaceae bacterium]